MGISGGILGKKQLNLIIGFDAINYNLKIMRILSRDYHSVKTDFVSVNQDYFIRGEWEKIIAEGLPEFLSKQSFDQSFAVHLVLPDGVIGTDIFNVPTLGRAKMETALDTQMKDLYYFYNDYKFNTTIVSSNKTNTTFEVVMASKSLLNRIYKALNEQKLYVKNATFAANATVNAALALRPKNRKQSFIMLDISPESARVIAVSGGQTVGWKQLKFGYNVFAYEKVMIENNIVFNDTAQIAVINATEKAKKKKMTGQVDEDEDDAAIIEENAIVVNEIDKHSEEINKIENSDLAEVIDSAEAIRAEKDKKIASGENADVLNSSAASGAVLTENSSAAENYAENNSSENNSSVAENSAEAATEEKAETKAEVKPEPPKVKAYQRKLKKLPAYMQRPAPETIEGVRVENFRLFVKHVMLMKMQIEQGGIYDVPRYALVNMPKDYAYIVGETNKEDDSDGFEFRFFEPEKEDNVELSEHLDLFGALFMGQFNKINNV